ncbi:kinase-like protein [Rickenella mellea]|uniref:Kinase-like protein n=1 Tax=Rickenella mellea TaxID=50990 RepID=A0A4Y7PYJ9_9AGAM|nr:kinase-like protein [Rickenella mellea]
MAFTEHQLREELSELDITSHVRKIGEFSNAIGGYSDVWKCTCGLDLTVAVKVIRLGDHDKARSLKKISQEIQNWWRLNDHPNVLSLLGVCFWGTLPSPESAWMTNGTVDVYIKNNPDIDICFALHGIAEGLRYLHEQNIVHGDVKAKNVVKSDEGNPQLADFGLSRNLIAMIDESTAVNITGSWRWMAVEFFEFDARRQLTPRQLRPSKSSDVWSFGMTVLELWSGSPPFVDIVRDVALLVALRDKQRPDFPKPPRRGTLRFRDHGWLHNLCDQCWVLEPTERPTMEEIATNLRRRVEPINQTQNQRSDDTESCNSSESSDDSDEPRTPKSIRSNLNIANPTVKDKNSTSPGSHSQSPNVSSPVEGHGDRILPSPTILEPPVTVMMADIDILGDERMFPIISTFTLDYLNQILCFASV